ncbi:MAG: Hpt domain-containing protein [Boseongicola sp.]|nr:Hpt domain-containing protein [Boseongicola sp.]
MIDWNRIEELKSEVGEDDFAEVVEMFFEEVAEALERLSVYSTETVAKDLHFVKGSALNIGLSRVSELCRAAEAAFREAPDADLNINAIQTAFNNSKTELKTVFAL